jgi:hypothetical protein
MDEQLTLTTEWVDLTQEELIKRGHDLADALRELSLIEEEHTARKKEMKEQRETVEAHIASLAAVIRSGKEERPIVHERAG